MRSRSDQNKLIEWLNALIVMAQWDKILPSYLARLFNKPEQYQQALHLITAGPPETTPDKPGDALNEEEWRKFYKFTTRAESLRKLFATGRDPFHGADKNDISLLAELSDLTTDLQTLFYSQNGTFQWVLETVRQRPELETASLITAGLNKFFTLLDKNEAVAKKLYELACSNDWHVVLASLNAGRDYTTDESPAAKQSLANWNRDLTDELREILLKPTKLYRVPQKLIKLAWERRNLFKDALVTIPTDSRLTGFELRQQVSNVAYPLFVKDAKSEIEEIESDLQLMAVVARHYISVRKFVKLDGLVSGWPKIASQAMANFRNLEYVEDFFVDKTKQRPTQEELDKRDARELYDHCANDQTVIRFLRLRPYFKEIDEDELRRYRPLAAVSIADPAQPSTPTIITPPAATMEATPVAPTAARPARNCQLVITVAKDRPGCEVLFVTPVSEVKAFVQVPVDEILDRMLKAIGVVSEESLQSIMTGLFSGPNAEQTIVRAGAQLLNIFITQSGLEEQLANELRGDGPVRLVITSDSEVFQYLPWEWLPRPGYAELLLSNPRFSLVRSSYVRPIATTVPLNPPVKVLGVFPNSPVGSRDISESSIKSLEVASEGGQFRSLIRDNASVIRMTDELVAHTPHIVHFEGYVNFLSEMDRNVAFILSSLTASTEAINLARFSDLLYQNHVQLFVMGRNESSRTFGNGGAAISHRLIVSGVPAVLAPIRAVDDTTATALTTEFYRAFLAGHNLEQALYTARRKVASRGGDWTPFVLFANPEVLDFFQPLPPTA